MPKLTVACESGHERILAVYDPSQKVWRCPDCREWMSDEGALRSIPPGYRPAQSALGAVLQAMADYDLLLIITGPNKTSVEYPRTEVNPAHQRRFVNRESLEIYPEEA
jgi:hypothetical protein